MVLQTLSLSLSLSYAIIIFRKNKKKIVRISKSINLNTGKYLFLVFSAKLFSPSFLYTFLTFHSIFPLALFPKYYSTLSFSSHTFCS